MNLTEPVSAVDRPADAPTSGRRPVPMIVTLLHFMAMAAGGMLLVAGVRTVALLIGWSAPSTTANVAAVAMGVALGGWFAVRRLEPRFEPLPAIVLAQAVAGVSTVLAFVLFAAARSVYLALWHLLEATGPGVALLRLGLAMSLLSLPAACFGGAAVLFVRARGADYEPPAAGGDRVALTMAGIAAGIVIAATALLTAFGLRGTLFVGIALSGLAAAGTALIRRFGPEGRGNGAALRFEPQSVRAAGRPRVLETLIPLLYGAAAWGLFICWERILRTILGPTGPLTTIIAMVYLLGLGLGASVIARAARRVAEPGLALALLLASAALLAQLSAYLVPRAAVVYVGLTPAAAGAGLFSFTAVLIAALLLLPTALPLGAALTLLPRLAGREDGVDRTGILQGIATLAAGAVLSELIVRLTLIPAVGLRRALAINAAGVLGAALLSIWSLGLGPVATRRTATIVGVGLLVALVGFPASWDPRLFASGAYRYGAQSLQSFESVPRYVAALRAATPVFYREGRDQTVMIERTVHSTSNETAIEALQLTIDGRVAAGNVADLRTQILVGHLPLLVHGSARNVLLIDSPGGVTAGSILRHPIASLTTIEGEPAVYEAAAGFEAYNHRPLDDPRFEPIVDDARARLQADRSLYDVIVIGAPAPWLAPGASLMTLEGYRQLRDRLEPGGLVAQRLAVSVADAFSIGITLRTFAREFESVLLFRVSQEDLILVGGSGPIGIDVGRIRSLITSNLEIAADLSRAIAVGPNELVMALRVGGAALRSLIGDGPLDTDDRALVRTAAQREMRVHENSALLGAIDAAGSDDVVPWLRNFGDDPDERAKYLFSLAKSFLGMAGDPLRATAIGAELTRLGEPVMAGWVNGEALLQQGAHDGALREWENVLEIDPGNLDALFSLGTYYLDRSDYFAADRYLARAAGLHGQTAVVRYHYGRNLLHMGRHAASIEHLKAAREVAGGVERFPLIDYFLGVAQLRLKRLDEAEGSLRAYLEWAYGRASLTPLEIEAHLKLAEVYEQQGDVMKGRQERDKGMKLQMKLNDFARQQGGGTGRPLVMPSPGRPPSAPAASGTTGPARPVDDAGAIDEGDPAPAAVGGEPDGR